MGEENHQNNIPLRECLDFKQEVKKHLDDSVGVRRQVDGHELRITKIEDYIEKQGNLKSAIFLSSGAVIVTILLACLGWAVLWGRLMEKTDRLEKLHPYGIGLQKVDG